MANLHAHRVPGGICADITHCRNDMWNCLECVHFTPEKEQLLYFEEQAKAWRKKAEIFKDYSIMEANFLEIADRFQQIIQKMRKETLAVQPILIQKQEQMRQQTIEEEGE